MIHADVGVIGGGPAGAVLAGALARRGRSVVLVEKKTASALRVGETLGAEVRALVAAFSDLELHAAVDACTLPFHGVRATWGSPIPEERPSILNPLGAGWHVDRRAFDAALRAWAFRGGARIEEGAGPWRATRSDDDFVLTCTGPAEDRVHVRFVVDASGRGAAGSTGLRARSWLACDRQIALVARTGPVARAVEETELELEAVEDGWWYSVPQPDGALLAVWITDADLLPPGRGVKLDSIFSTALENAPNTRARLAKYPPLGAARIVRSGTGRLVPSAGRGWCAVGDAACAVDPLSGEGVARALKSALSTTPRVLAALDGAPLDVTRDDDRAFAQVLELRDRYHAVEARWPSAPYWARRRPIGWREAPLWLAPETPLRATTKAATSTADRDHLRDTLAPIEALIPPRALERTLTALTGGAPCAHELLAMLRTEAPLGDRRLLVGLQALVGAGLAEPTA